MRFKRNSLLLALAIGVFSSGGYASDVEDSRTDLLGPSTQTSKAIEKAHENSEIRAYRISFGSRGERYMHETDFKGITPSKGKKAAFKRHFLSSKADEADCKRFNAIYRESKENGAIAPMGMRAYAIFGEEICIQDGQHLVVPKHADLFIIADEFCIEGAGSVRAEQVCIGTLNKKYFATVSKSTKKKIKTKTLCIDGKSRR